MKKKLILSVLFISILIVFIASVSFAFQEENVKDARITKNSLSNFQEDKMHVMVTGSASKTGRLSINGLESRFEDRIKNEFSLFNGFSATLTKEEIEDLIAEGYLVYEDIEVQAFLQDSTHIINVTKTWQTKQNSLNLTGLGQTICVIDTGVNYSHPDLGGCTLPVLTLNGTNESYILETAHPYNSDNDSIWSISMPGYSSIAVHFVNISTEKSFDFIRIYDNDGNEVASYSGNKSDIWTPSVSGDSMTIRLVSDQDTESYGFYIDQIINGSTNMNYNWSNCGKVIGGWDSDSSDPDPYDDNGHGTHVAGIVAANGSAHGVAPDAKLVVVKSLNSVGSGQLGNTASGIEWCINNSQRYNISVISMSLGISFRNSISGISNPSLAFNSSGLNNNSISCDEYYPYFTDLIGEAIAKNISVTVAAGNDHNNTHISFPSCITGVTRVTAANKLDTVASYSNRNALVRLIAPGTDINSTMIQFPYGDLGCSNGIGYCLMDGTSMATPHVAGSIAIIRQYLSLTNQNKTPLQIEDALDSNGIAIYDSASDRNYSRIDIFNTITSFDLDVPNVSLVSPSEGYISSNGNVTFSCNAYDLYLKNVSLYIWNASSFANITNLNISGQNYTYEINLSNISSGTYSWNCLFVDENDNSAIATSNSTFSVGNSIVTLNTPLNNTYSNVSNTNFSCFASSLSEFDLNNLTFLLWNSSSLVYNVSRNVSGQTNTSMFNYTFSSETSYYWNCLSFNNASNLSISQNNNTFTFDNTRPVLNLISPIDSYSSTSNSEEVTFAFNASDNMAINNCTFRMSDGFSEVKISITNNLSVEQSFTRTLTPGTYYWNISCLDYAGNQNMSSTRNLTITAVASSSGSRGGGGGGGGGAGTTTTVKESQLKEGYSKTFKKGEKVKFNVSKEEHTLTVKELLNNSAILTLRSEAIDFKLSAGETKKFNLSGSDYYDLSVTLSNINKSGATVLIKKINEAFNIKENYPNVTILDNETEMDTNQTTLDAVKKRLFEKSSIWVYIILSLVAFGIILFINARYGSKGKHHPDVHKIYYNVNKNNFR